MPERLAALRGVEEFRPVCKEVHSSDCRHRPKPSAPPGSAITTAPDAHGNPCRHQNSGETPADIAYCTPHDLRRSSSTLAQRAGVDRHTVKDLDGWSEVSVVERHYTGQVKEAHRRAMWQIAGTA